jgi:MFS family permease
VSSWGSTVTSGYIGDRFVSKTALMLGLSLALIGVSYFILGIAETYTVLLAAMLLVGLGPSIYHPPAIGALSRRFAHRRAFYISMHGAGGSAGEAIGPLLAGGLIAVLYWRDVLQLSMIPAFITAFAMWTLLRNDKSEQEGASSLREYFGAFKELLRIRAVQLIYLATAFRTVGQATTMVFLPIYMREDLGYSAWLAGVFISLAQVVGIGSQPVMGHLTDRIGYKRVLVPALVCFAVLLALIPAASGKVQLAIVIVLLGTFLFSLHAILIAAAAELAGEAMQATTVSLIYSASFVGALAPTFAGVLADAYGFGSTFLFAAILVALSAVTLAVTKLPGSRLRPA